MGISIPLGAQIMEIRKCPHCQTRVVPLPDRVCPSCRRSFDDPVDAVEVTASDLATENAETRKTTALWVIGVLLVAFLFAAYRWQIRETERHKHLNRASQQLRDSLNSTQDATQEDQ